MDEIEFLESQIRELKKILQKLDANLIEIEHRKAKLIDPLNVPLDLEGAEERTRDEIARIEEWLAENKKLLAELEPDQPQLELIDIPFIIVAMNNEEASALMHETIFDSREIAPAERIRFQTLKSAFPEEEIEKWLSHYSEDRESWRPLTNPESTIHEIISEIVTIVNQLQLEMPTTQLIRPQFYSASFFSDDEDIQEETWNELGGSGCVLIIDAISLFHPHIRQTLSDSQMGSKKQVAMLVLSPVSPSVNEANQLIEKETRSRMRRAFARFDKHLDKFCEVGVGDLRALRRWLFAILPEAVTIVQNRRPHPNNKRNFEQHMQQQGISRRGIEQAIFGQRGK